MNDSQYRLLKIATAYPEPIAVDDNGVPLLKEHAEKATLWALELLLQAKAVYPTSTRMAYERTFDEAKFGNTDERDVG